MDVYTLKQGGSPLVISVPHAGTQVPEEIAAGLTPLARALPDTDWYVDRLYADFAERADVTLIRANYSRYVIDLNRPPDDAPLYPGQAKIPLCPDKTFDGRDIYQDGTAPDAEETKRRLTQYWQPYHAALAAEIARVKALHGHAVLYDAHSIRSEIPRLFEGRLPDLNLGTAGGKSCAGALAQAAFAAAQDKGFSAVLNGRFIGGYITRHYGDPARNIHAVQMELAACNYMDEDSFAFDEGKAARLRPVLEGVLQALSDSVKSV